MSDQPVRGGAVLYTVQGPRGSYYAIHDPGTGRICTESSDPRVRAQARDMGLIVVNEETITHQELLRRTGRDADVAAQVTNPVAKTNPAPEPLTSPGSGHDLEGETGLPPQPSFFLEDTGESLTLRHTLNSTAVFSSHPLEPEPKYSNFSDDGGLWGNMPALNPPEEDWTAPERPG